MGKMKVVDALLPRNRFQQFKNVLSHHLWELMLASVYTFIFSAPALAWIIFTSYVRMFQENYLLNLLFIYVPLMLLLIPFGLGFGGGLFFFKKLLFGEGADLNSDYFLGIRRNGRMFTAIFLFIGFLYLALHAGLGAISATAWNEGIKAMMMGFAYVFFFLLLFVSFMMESQTILFEGGFAQLFLSGCRFMFATLYQGIGIYALMLVPFLLFEFVPFAVADWVALLLCSFFWLGLAELLLMQWSNHVFDFSVNRKQYPQNYRKGLSSDEKSSDDSVSEI